MIYLFGSNQVLPTLINYMFGANAMTITARSHTIFNFLIYTFFEFVIQCIFNLIVIYFT